MTSFVNDSGEYLEYNGPDITLNKQAVAFFEFLIKGDFSQNFSIDNNSYNRDVLGYQSAMQVSNPAFSKSTFTLVRNGNKIMRGFIVITEVDVNTINCFFLGGNASWFNQMGVNLKDMNWEEFSTIWSSFASTYSNTSGMVFPDVDWGYNGSKRGDEISYYIFTERANNTGEVPAQKLSDQYPCMFLHSIVTKIANETGIKITGNLLTDHTYLGMVVTPNGPDLKWPTTQTEPYRAFVDRSSSLSLNANDTLVWNNIISDGESANYDTSTGIYTARRSATYKVTLNIVMATADTYEFYLYKNGADITIIFPDTLGSFTAYQGVFYINLAKGDYFEVKIQSIGVARTLNTGSNMLVEISEKIEPISFASNNTGVTGGISNYISASAIVPNMKAVDMIKFLTNYFNCVCSFDVEENQITLTKLNTITDVEDWSDYYQSHEETYNRNIATNNYIKFQPSSEPDIVRYNEVTDTPYGGGNIETDYTVKRDNTLYQIPFGAAYDQRNKTYLGWNKPFIEFFRLEDSPDASFEYTSVTDSSGDAVFNHTGTADSTTRRVYRIVSNSGIYSGYGVKETVATGSPTSTDFYGVDYVSDDTGRIIAQEAQRITGPHRLLYVIPGASAADSGGPATTVMTAFFDKPLYDETIDNIKISLAISNIEGRAFNHTIGELYHQKLKNGFNSPIIRARMILPESVYQSYNFDKFVRVRAKNLDGLFYANKISAYMNSKSECLVELIFT